MIKHTCLVCGKPIANLLRHMRKIHNKQLFYNPPASSLQSFISIIAHFPLSPFDWKTLINNKEVLESFLIHGRDLPPEIYKILSLGLQYYQSKSHKLTLLSETKLNESESVSVGCFESLNQPVKIAVDKEPKRLKHKLIKKRINSL